MAGRFSIEGVFKIRDRASATIRRLQDRLNRFTRSADGHSRILQRVGSVIRTGVVAALCAMAVAAAVAARALQHVIEVGMEFDRSLAAAGARFGNIRRGTEAFEELEAAARRVGVQTEFSASEAARGLDFLAVAGFSAQQAIAALPGVVDLATAAQLDLAEATDIASDILGNQGLMTEDAAQLTLNLARVNDVLAQTSSTANTDVRQLFEAFRTGGPAAHAAGASIETFSALAGTLAGAGIKGAEAGTALRTMFLRLVNPAREGRRAIRTLGLDIEDSEGNMTDMVDIIGQLQTGLEGRGGVERGQLLAQLFGARGVTAANVLLEAGSEELRTYRTSLEGAEGAAAEMAETMRDTAAGDLAAMKSAIEGMALQIWDVIRGPVRAIIEGITEWVRANQGWLASGFREGVQWLITNLPTINTWMRRIGIAIAILASPLIAIAALFVLVFGAVPALLVGVGAAAVALFDLIKEAGSSALETLSDFFSSVWQRIVANFAATVEFIVGLWTIATGLLIARFGPWFDLFALLAARIRERFEPVGTFFADLWTAIAARATDMWNAFIAPAIAVRDILISIWTPLAEFFTNLWAGIVSTFESTVGPILASIGASIDLIRGVGRETLEGEGEEGGEAPQVIGPEERVARSISETTTTARSEVTIRPAGGATAEVTRQPRTGAQLQVAESGAT